LKTSDFNYDLPKDFIAQTPIEPRDSSRLMIVERSKGIVQGHTHFHNLGKFIEPGDLVVLNETRVIPARIFGKKIPNGGHVELLLLERKAPNIWECLVGGKGINAGRRVLLEDGSSAKVIINLNGSRRMVEFENQPDQFLEKYGHMPLPPYIHEKLNEPERYQTVFSKEAGSTAAPTAGLHFSQDLIEQLENNGVTFTKVILHVGLDTFAPVKGEYPQDHEIHSEWCQISPTSAEKINQTKMNGGKIFAVGTTSVRVIETAATKVEEKNIWTRAFEGYTNLFILPGFDFKVTDAIITNFHLPRSTLIMMIAAFMGRENILNAYEIAKKKKYRFYSFGDAMLIK
jgi:S-adenosylmethionine:tRNA ribosyltransferase-isomerase